MSSFARSPVALIAILALSAALCFGFILHKAPWTDEGWSSVPGVTLATKGYMGSPTVVETGTQQTDLPGIHERTYWQPPLFFVVMGGWLKIFGVGLTQSRSLSMVWGLLLLVAIYRLAEWTTRSREIGLLAALLGACDLMLLSRFSDTRFDTQTAALAFLGYTAYISLRDRGVVGAWIAAHCFAAASSFTHPNGLLAPLGLTVLFLSLDRKRFSWKLAYGAIPYLVIGGVYLIYVLQAPHDAWIQIQANTAHRVRDLTHPWLAVWYEIRYRYFEGFGLAPGTPLAERGMAMFLAAYWGGLAYCLLRRNVRTRPEVRAVLLVFGAYMTFFVFVESNRYWVYLIHVAPWYLILLSTAIGDLWARPGRWRVAVAIGTTAYVGVAIGGALLHIFGANHMTEFRNVSAYVLRGTPTPRSVTAPTYFGYGIGFDTVVDDLELGYRTGVKTPLMILDPDYRGWIEKHIQVEEPQVYRYITDLLANDYTPVYRVGRWEVLARKNAESAAAGGPVR